MNRRRFLQALSVVGAALAAPRGFASDYTLSSAPSGVSMRRLREARAVIVGDINYVKPPTMPRVINVFLYGGPSELAGNLTNIDEINSYTINKYPAALLAGGTGRTANGFWAAAGGTHMENMLRAGQLSVYRTVNRIADDNKAHGRSITQNQHGSPDVGSAGMATKLAAVLGANAATAFAKPLSELFLPFVSFEGSSRMYYGGDNPLSVPFELKHITVDVNPSATNNAFARAANAQLPVGADDDAIEALAAGMSAGQPKFSEMSRSLVNRAKLANFIATTFNATAINAALPLDPANGNLPIVYPNTVFGNALKSAVSLLLMNPDTLFVSVNGGGVGWDDHNIAISAYTARMDGLMAALSVAAKHLSLAARNDIVINVFGDFGRNAYINDSLGWDHGNNQTFYTLGGSAVRIPPTTAQPTPPATLGKIVGSTRVINGGVNRVFTTPATDSYQFEPFAIAASVYRYFGVQNPQLLTEGFGPIDETTASIRLV